jgi:hypothetical protein
VYVATSNITVPSLIALQDLLGWIVALIFAMVLWTVVYVVIAAWNLQDIDSDWQTSDALSWIASLAYAFSCIIILCIAKHVSWRNSPMSEPMPGTDAYGSGTDAYGSGTDAYGSGTDAYGSGTDAYGYGTSQPPYHVHAHNSNTSGQPPYYQHQAPVRNGVADHFDPFKP